MASAARRRQQQHQQQQQQQQQQFQWQDSYSHHPQHESMGREELGSGGFADFDSPSAMSMATNISHRRQLGFMKYGVVDKKQRNKQQTREHSKQLVEAFSQDPSYSFDTNFSSSNGFHSNTNNNKGTQQRRQNQEQHPSYGVSPTFAADFGSAFGNNHTFNRAPNVLNNDDNSSSSTNSSSAAAAEEDFFAGLESHNSSKNNNSSSTNRDSNDTSNSTRVFQHDQFAPFSSSNRNPMPQQASMQSLEMQSSNATPAPVVRSIQEERQRRNNFNGTNTGNLKVTITTPVNPKLDTMHTKTTAKKSNNSLVPFNSSGAETFFPSPHSFAAMEKKVSNEGNRNTQQFDTPPQKAGFITMPTNSSMQLEFPGQTRNIDAVETQTRKTPGAKMKMVPLKSPVVVGIPHSMSGASSVASSSSAVARRRMRKQQEQQLRTLNHGNDAISFGAATESPQQRRQLQTHHRSTTNATIASDSSGGSSSRGNQFDGTVKSTNHVAHYQNRTSQLQQQVTMTPTRLNRTSHHSQGSTNSTALDTSFNSANQSVGSSTTAGYSDGGAIDVNLFDPTQTHGFTFDAFGLDAAQMNREMDIAMQDIAGTTHTPDLSFFLESAAGAAGDWKWDETSKSSRASTPPPTNNSTFLETSADSSGFVDGFRVSSATTKATDNRPHDVLVKQTSPSRSDKSSLTNDSNNIHKQFDGNGGVNPFKVQAAFHASVSGSPIIVIRPQLVESVTRDSQHHREQPQDAKTTLSKSTLTQHIQNGGASSTTRLINTNTLRSALPLQPNAQPSRQYTDTGRVKSIKHLQQETVNGNDSFNQGSDFFNTSDTSSTEHEEERLSHQHAKSQEQSSFHVLSRQGKINSSVASKAGTNGSFHVPSCAAVSSEFGYPIHLVRKLKAVDPRNVNENDIEINAEKESIKSVAVKKIPTAVTNTSSPRRYRPSPTSEESDTAKTVSTVTTTVISDEPQQKIEDIVPHQSIQLQTSSDIKVLRSSWEQKSHATSVIVSSDLSPHARPNLRTRIERSEDSRPYQNIDLQKEKVSHRHQQPPGSDDRLFQNDTRKEIDSSDLVGTDGLRIRRAQDTDDEKKDDNTYRTNANLNWDKGVDDSSSAIVKQAEIGKQSSLLDIRDRLKSTLSVETQSRNFSQAKSDAGGLSRFDDSVNVSRILSTPKNPAKSDIGPATPSPSAALLYSRIALKRGTSPDVQSPNTAVATLSPTKQQANSRNNNVSQAMRMAMREQENVSRRQQPNSSPSLTKKDSYQRDSKMQAVPSPSSNVWVSPKKRMGIENSKSPVESLAHSVLRINLSAHEQDYYDNRNNPDTNSSQANYEKNAETIVQAPKTLTYRERRELEIRKQREMQEQNEHVENSTAKEGSMYDVQSLIRKRIAATKSITTEAQPSLATPNATNDNSSENISAYRLKLRPVRTERLEQNSFDEKRMTEHDSSERQPIEYTRSRSNHSGQVSQYEDNVMRENENSIEHHESISAVNRAGTPNSSSSTMNRVGAAYVDEEPRSHTFYEPHILHQSEIVDKFQVHERQGDEDKGRFREERVSVHIREKDSSTSSEKVEHEMHSDTGAHNSNNTARSGTIPRFKREQTALSVECDESKFASPTLSHMLMLQQLQQRKPNDTISPPLSKSQHNTRSLTSLTTDHEDCGDNRIQAKGGSTPKATMMMLNAFLAGRESLTANDVGSSSSKLKNSDDSEAGSGKESVTPSSNKAQPALKDDPAFAKYFKMLSLGMPIDVAKHAMTRDGLDPTILDGDPNKPAGIPLKDDPDYAKYFRMLNIGLPMEAIKHAMARDNLDPSVMDQDHNLPVYRGEKRDDKPSKEEDSHRRARLHWKTLRKVTSNSLWAQIDQDGELDRIEIDEDEFQELFQEEKGVISQSAKKANFAGKRGSTVCVIDTKRANNGGIILARLKMSHDDLADAVDRIDERPLSAEQIENIIEYLPTKEERRALEAYMLEGGQDAAEKFDCLCECEKFMVSMMTVKHAKRKLSALLFKLQFETCLQDIQKEADLIGNACLELINSGKLRLLLGYVLSFGNRLNTAGNGKRKAGAFTIDSLLKLNQAKAFDKKTTFLHYIVLIVRRNNYAILDFKEDLPSVFAAEKVFWDQCVGDLDEVENQLENLRKIALYQAHQHQGYRLRQKKKASQGQEQDESFSDSEIVLSLEEEVEALRSTPIGLFTLNAIRLVSMLRDKVESTNRMFNETLEYLGEDDNKKQPHELFGIIVSFSREFEKAKDEVVNNEKKKLREERKRQSNPTSGNEQARRAAQNPRGGGMLKASNHQPNLSHVLNEFRSKPNSLAQPQQPLGLVQQISQIELQEAVQESDEYSNEFLLSKIQEEDEDRATTPVGEIARDTRFELPESQTRQRDASRSNSIRRDDVVILPNQEKNLYPEATASTKMSQRSNTSQSVHVAIAGEDLNVTGTSEGYNDDTSTQTSGSLDVGLVANSKSCVVDRSKPRLRRQRLGNITIPQKSVFGSDSVTRYPDQVTMVQTSTTASLSGSPGSDVPDHSVGTASTTTAQVVTNPDDQLASPITRFSPPIRLPSYPAGTSNTVFNPPPKSPGRNISTKTTAIAGSTSTTSAGNGVYPSTSVFTSVASRAAIRHKRRLLEQQQKSKTKNNNEDATSISSTVIQET